MEKFKNMSNTRVQQVLSALVATVLEACENNNIEEPRFAIFVFNDPERALLTTTAEKKELIRECGSSLVLLMKDDVHEMLCSLVKIIPMDKDDTATPSEN